MARAASLSLATRSRLVAGGGSGPKRSTISSVSSSMARIVGRGGQALVQRQAHGHVGDVALGQQRRQAQLDFGGRGQRPVEHRLAAFLERLHGLFEQVEVHASGRPR